MKKFLLLALVALLALPVIGAPDDKDDKKEKTIALFGRVRERITNIDLPKTMVYILGDGDRVLDSCQANKGIRFVSRNVVDTISTFMVTVPRQEAFYMIRFQAPGYKTYEMPYKLEKIGRRENYRDLPPVFLDRAPRQLKEVTVTQSKIKFYSKGDTLVYNADAFQLAEGSMLDALIAQLPGAELNSDGQIKVNGQFVESLLLNGKEFMDGNNNLMLENIGAYTVKDIQVYEGQTPEAKRTKDIAAEKVLTMDVRLKKEYNMGWIVNAQAGYGTDDRYLGRAFVNWFNATTRVTAIGNVNNLNDNRKPGRGDTWTPDKMPVGTVDTYLGALEYSYESPDEKTDVRGRFDFEQTLDRTSTVTSRTNFLPGSDTYDYNFGDSRRRETRASVSQSQSFEVGSFNLGAFITGNYSNAKSTNSSLSSTFDSEQQGITPRVLEAIYSDGSPERLDAIINRSSSTIDSRIRLLRGAVNPWVRWKLPKTTDYLSWNGNYYYSNTRQFDWRDYQINYGADPSPAVRQRQYINGTPNHKYSIQNELSYISSTLMGNRGFIQFSYNHLFSDEVKDSRMYRLDRLNDMGQYGILPGDYDRTFDPANSYNSHLFTNSHRFNLFMNKQWAIDTTALLSLSLRPIFEITHRKLHYWRDNEEYSLSKNSASLTLSSLWSACIEYSFGPIDKNGRKAYRNFFRYSYRLLPTLPEMTDMLPVTDDSDPLNIYKGNPGLKTAWAHKHLIRWHWQHADKPLSNIFYLGADHATNSLRRGYTYDTSTGVRVNRMYNVNGVRRFAITNEFSLQFGKRKQFTLSTTTDAATSRDADMIGINLSAPELTRITNRLLTQNVKLSWQIGQQSIGIRGDYTNRHTTSSQPGFSTIDAHHIVAGISGVFILPHGFGISTDFNCYTRRGYGSSDLDTTDPLWNVRLSYSPPRNSRWVFMADGFDLLHKLTNVKYAVTATGRTVSYTNTIPRYFMISVQYRLNIQPKKR